MVQKTNRISTDLRKLYKKPKVSDKDMLSDYIEGIDETCPTYKGFDIRGNIWIGPISSYKRLDENKILNEDGQRVEIIMKDSTSGNEVGRDYEIFNSFKFKKALTEGILHFEYRKINGDLREAYGTTKPDVLRSNGCRIVFDRRRKVGNNIRYFDMQYKAWRSFKPDNLVKIFESVDMSQT